VAFFAFWKKKDMGAKKITQATLIAFGTTFGGIFLKIFYKKSLKSLQNSL
jgi:hypothetical protein